MGDNKQAIKDKISPNMDAIKKREGKNQGGTLTKTDKLIDIFCLISLCYQTW